MRIAAPLNNDVKPRLQWIEVASFVQLPTIQIIGLPAQEVSEAKERIRAAIHASGLEIPKRRIIVNLSPASVIKRGTGIDLAMAVAILSSSMDNNGETIRANARNPARPPQKSLAAWGELGLDGAVKPVSQIVRAVYAAWDASLDYLMVASDEFAKTKEALALLCAGNILKNPAPAIIPVSSLAEAWKFLNCTDKSYTIDSGIDPSMLKTAEKPKKPINDFHDLLPLPALLERSISLSIVGSHHLLLLGPKGAGKSHAIEWLITLQPPFSHKIQIERAILSELRLENCNLQLPVRKISPYVRPSALIGKASPQSIYPGEFSLAHGGLLVADELLEWHRDSREAMREPLERYTVTVTRASGSLEFPAQFVLAASGNLCPCGGWPPNFIENKKNRRETGPVCKCSVQERHRYLGRLSSAILDRIDLVCFATSAAHTIDRNTRQTSNIIDDLRNKVFSARERAIKSWGAPPGLLSSAEIELLIKEHPGWSEHLNSSADTIGELSLRGRHKIARMALSLAAINGQTNPSAAEFAEATYYRHERLGHTSSAS
ncbi:MAG: ATP-binding protein [Bdellovibrionota bacterium]